MSNFKSQAKRKRELAKLDKRQAKEQKRALRRAERSGADASSPTPVTALAQPQLLQHRPTLGMAPPRKPTTLAEAVEVWKKTKLEKPKKR
jgi:hypothetical protein